MFKFCHQPGQENLGNMYTKAHKARISNHVRPYYTHTEHSPRYLARAPMPSSMRGCVGMDGVSYFNRIPLPRVTGIPRQRKSIEPAGHNVSANPTQR